jgi:phage terminase large subunit-like protein
MAGLDLDDWQQFLLAESLSTAQNGQWAAFEVAVVVPRQNGKGGYLEARQLYGLFLGREQLAVHTAHEFKTCFEHFLRIVSLIENTPDLDARVSRIRRGAGEQAIELKTGQRLRFLARSSGSGRGMSGDTVYLDEAYDLTPEMMGALLPTLSARPNPQVVYTSSAPRLSSTVLHDIVRRGRAGDSPRLFYAEWGNSPGIALNDRDAWRRANPAMGIRISEEFIEAELEAMQSMPQEFLRERLGVPDSMQQTGEIALDAWQSLVDPASEIVGSPTIALDVSPERDWASFAAAGKRADGLDHVEVIDRRPGTGWVVDRAIELAAKWSVPIVVDPSSPAGNLLGDLSAANVKTDELSRKDHAQACGALVDAVRNESLRHLGQPSLLAALTGAQKRTTGDVWMWSRTGSHVDITPLVAATLALWASRTAAPQKLTHTASAFVSLDDY